MQIYVDEDINAHVYLSTYKVTYTYTCIHSHTHTGMHTHAVPAHAASVCVRQVYAGWGFSQPFYKQEVIPACHACVSAVPRAGRNAPLPT